MTPDPEQERAWRERIDALFADAPEPDAARLAMALSAVKAGSRRSRHRALAWLAGAILLGGGMAAAAWWASSGDSTHERAPDSTTPAQSEPEGSVRQQERGDDAATGATTADDGIIYQRSD